MPDPSPPLTVLEVLRRSTDWLRRRGVETPRVDAEVLLAHALGMRRLDLYLRHDRPISEGERERARELVRRRGEERVPVAYLTGEREFFSLSFEVDPSVLIPRPETEHLVEAGLAVLRPREAPLFLDVGTGSGCVAVALLKHHPSARGHATDTSSRALEVAGRNARRHGVADRLTLHRGDLLRPLEGHPDRGHFAAVLSNPPYLVRGDPTIAPEVVRHEPAEALFVSGRDPLEVARAVAEQALPALAPGGLLALEVGAGSAAGARTLLDGLGYEAVEIARDLGSVERIVSGRRPAAT